jgi:hypothetical protein
MKIYSFNFASHSLGNISRKYEVSNGSFFLVHGIYKIFHQVSNAWMARTFYSVPLVEEFPHSLFLAPGIFWQANSLFSNE